ncbi:hypothetical protein [Sodalinema gerasimenkoae]|nr:hypothetical protein [Sodalinema gerasimenkoae]
MPGEGEQHLGYRSANTVRPYVFLCVLCDSVVLPLPLAIPSWEG